MGRPKLLADLHLFLSLIESPLVNLALVGRAAPFSRLASSERERYLLRWADSPLPLRRTAFQAVKRLVLFLAYARDSGNPLWEGTGYVPPALPPVPPAAIALRPRVVSEGETIACDVCVVGSGAGGAVAAAELAAAGKGVVVLEKGGNFSEPDFDGREDRGAARLFWDRQLLATDDLGVSVFAGCTVGGGTVVNWNTSLRLPTEIREEWEALGVDGLGPELDEHYAVVERRLDIDRNESERNAQNQVLARGLDALGLEWSVIPRNVKGCGDCGHCGYGCRRGAKQSMPRTYLADATARGAVLIADCEAARVLTERGTAVGVAAAQRRGDGPRRFTVRARAVVLAGGAIGTPAVLLRSGLGGPEVGRSLLLHPVPAVVAFYDEPIRTWSGVPQSVVSAAFARIDGNYGFRLEVPSALPGVLAAALPWRSAEQHRALMRRLDHVAAIIPVVRDREAGSVVVDRNGAAILRYRVRGSDAANCARAIVAAAGVHLAAGAREVLSPHTKPIPLARGGDAEAFGREVRRRGVAANRVAIFSAHQMSTARMGRDGAASVADQDGAVRGVKGLWVADASAFPNACGVNPMLTVMAIARRNTRRLLALG